MPLSGHNLLLSRPQPAACTSTLNGVTAVVFGGRVLQCTDRRRHAGSCHQCRRSNSRPGGPRFAVHLWQQNSGQRPQAGSGGLAPGRPDRQSGLAARHEVSAQQLAAAELGSAAVFAWLGTQSIWCCPLWPTCGSSIGAMPGTHSDTPTPGHTHRPVSPAHAAIRGSGWPPWTESATPSASPWPFMRMAGPSTPPRSTRVARHPLL